MKYSVSVYGVISAVSLLCRGIQSNIIYAPSNVAVYEGSVDTTMICVSTESPLNWYVRPFSNPNGYSIPVQITATINGALFYPYDAMYHVARPSTGVANRFAYNLVIDRATPSAGGGPNVFSTAAVYECREPNLPGSNDEIRAAQLVVIKSDPRCTANITNSTCLKNGNGMQLTCTFVYASPRPDGTFNYPIDAILTWTVDGQPVQGASTIIQTSQLSNEVVATSTITVYNNLDADYQCQAVFGAPQNNPNSQNQQVIYATNAPAYSKTCNFTYHEPSCTDWTIVGIVLGLLFGALLITTAACLCWWLRFYKRKDTPTAVTVQVNQQQPKTEDVPYEISRIPIYRRLFHRY